MEAAGAAIASWLVGSTATAATLATATAVATGALTGLVTGAVIGAATSALSGGNILKGALMGGLVGAVSGGVMGYVNAPAAGVTGSSGGGAGGMGAATPTADAALQIGGSDPAFSAGLSHTTDPALLPPSGGTGGSGFTGGEMTPAQQYAETKLELAKISKEATKNAMYSGLMQGGMTGVANVAGAKIQGDKAEDLAEKQRQDKITDREANQPGAFEQRLAKLTLPPSWAEVLTDPLTRYAKYMAPKPGLLQGGAA